MKVKTALSVLVVPIAVFILSASCSRPQPAVFVLNDFESDADLDRIHWDCRKLFSTSDKHVSHGARSLEMKLFPAAYPGISLKLSENDWSRYARVSLDIFNAQNEPLEITVRIDDKADYPDYEDRYNGRHTLSPGVNHIRIPLDTLNTSGTGRPLNLKTIKRFMWFLVDTKEIYSFFVDYIRLDS